MNDKQLKQNSQQTVKVGQAKPRPTMLFMSVAVNTQGQPARIQGANKNVR